MNTESWMVRKESVEEMVPSVSMLLFEISLFVMVVLQLSMFNTLKEISLLDMVLFCIVSSERSLGEPLQMIGVLSYVSLVRFVMERFRSPNEIPSSTLMMGECTISVFEVFPPKKAFSVNPIKTVSWFIVNSP